jgi:hypothetical protein
MKPVARAQTAADESRRSGGRAEAQRGADESDDQRKQHLRSRQAFEMAQNSPVEQRLSEGECG